jgi:hypothetical protein
MALSKKNAALLGVIVAAMANEAAPYHMASEADIAGLAKEGLVETNAEIKDGDKFAVRATDAGIAAHNAAGASGDSGSTTSTPSAFVIDDGVPLPAGRGGRGANVYPFDALGVNQSFHVPASDAKPNPAKSLASTVSSATKRYVGKGDRKFVVRSVGDEDPRGKGARVFRTV